MVTDEQRQLQQQINRGKTINEVYELYPELVGINYKNPQRLSQLYKTYNL